MAAQACSRTCGPGDGQVGCVGDLICGGDQVATVIDMNMARGQIICLMGQHDAMLLGFPEDPAVT